MSSTNRGAKRHKADFYATPPEAVYSLLDRLELKQFLLPFQHNTILEPGAGNGNIVRAVNEYYDNLNWTLLELRDEEQSVLSGLGEVICPQDYLTWQTDRRFRLIIGNPPFSLWREFAERSLDLSNTVILLGRLSLLETKERHDFWQKHTPDVYVMSKRPSFTGGGTDSCAYAWFVWHENNAGKWFVI